MISRTLSQKFRFFTFACIALLLYVHGYNLKDSYLQPHSLVKEDLTFTTFFEYLFANGLLRFRIPMLFIISGYIFAMQDYRRYGERVKRRTFGLLIPYLIWSAAGLALTFLLQRYVFTAQIVESAKLDQLLDNRPYEQIGWGGMLMRWLVAPVSFQLWFIRSLFIYNLLYPVFRPLLLKYTYIWFGLLLIAWFFFFDFIFVEAQGMLFFSAGIWLYKRNYDIEHKPKWLSSYLCWLFFIGVAVIKTFMAFEFEENSPLIIPLFSVLYITIAVAGILAVWFSSDSLVKWAMSRKWFVWITAFSFIIYAMHVPLLPYFMKFISLYCPPIPGRRLITYLVAPAIIMGICVATGALLRKLVPSIYRISTGGRGF